MRSTDLAITFFTTLTVLANLATLGIVGLAVAARPAFAGPSGPIGHAWQLARPEIRTGGIGLAWLVAAVSMSGSLWFSEAEGFLPCRLCWIQRGCMYPLVGVLAVAALGSRLGRPGLERRARSSPSAWPASARRSPSTTSSSNGSRPSKPAPATPRRPARWCGSNGSASSPSPTWRSAGSS